MAEQKKSTTKSGSRSTAGAKPPAGAKQPQDRKPAKSDSQTIMIRGIELTVDESTINDFELMDEIGQLDDGDITMLPRVMRRIAGDKYRPLLETVRGDNGKVTLEAGSELVNEIIEALDPN